MEQTNSDTASVPMRATRVGASRKLLTRKALQQPIKGESPALEEHFPRNPPADTWPPPVSASSSLQDTAPAYGVPAPAAWSSEDEEAFQALLARRKAAGYRRHGKDLTAQLITPGSIRPNLDTVAATIVALVGEGGEISRGELLSRMATASFPHPKARAQDESWCQGYIAGAIRNGFLALAAESSSRCEEG